MKNKTINLEIKLHQDRLPKGWVWITIENILMSLESGGRPKGGVRNIKEGIPSIGGEHLLYSGGFNFTEIRYIPREFYEKMTRGKIIRKDILVVKDGATTGKTAFVSDSFPFSEVAVNEHIFILRVFEQYTEPQYLFFWMQSPFGQQCVKDNFQGTAQGGINSLFIKNSNLPLAPLHEQHRIVIRIEELFTKLDAGIEALRKVKAQLRQYRQAVLKYAFEGKLTEKWRKENRDRIEPVEALLGRIKEERKKYIGKKYKELPMVDVSDLPELPEGWMWVRVEEISLMIQYGTSEKARGNRDGIPVLRMGNIQEGRIVFDDLKYFPKGWTELNYFVLQDGDVLFNRTNSAELVGKTAVYKNPYPKAVFASYLIRVRVNRDAYIPDMLCFFTNSFYGRKYIASVISQQVGQANVNGTKLSLMPIPLPPLYEQQKIVEEIEKRFSVADEVDKVVEESLKQAERLRQSILKKAFEGKLVAQDPNDEPAEKLLERIRN